MLLLCSFGPAPDAAAAAPSPALVYVVVPQGQAAGCGCKASYTEDTNDLEHSWSCAAGSGSVLLIPMEPKATGGACEKVGTRCDTKEASVCRFTGKVKVSITGSACDGVYVQGGTTFPVARKVNTTVDVNLNFTAECAKLQAPQTQTTSSGAVNVMAQLGLAPVASYTVDLQCAGCAELTATGGAGAPVQPQ